MVRLGLMGAGNMGGAILRGVHGKGDFQLFAYDRRPESVASMAHYGVNGCSTLEELVRSSDYLILAVKPQNIDEVLKELPLELMEKNGTVVISIVTGVSTDYLRRNTYPGLKVVAVMPNTPLLLGAGATAVARPKLPVSQEELDVVCEIFGLCGKVALIEEEKIREIVAISGSSPAFLYLFCQAFVEYGRSQGFDDKLSTELFAQTMIGSARMLMETGMNPQQLIDMVTSPGGTTLAGLEALKSKGFLEAIAACCEACTKKAHANGRD